MTRQAWMDQPHEFREDVDDGSMCLCGVPALTHDLAIPNLPASTPWAPPARIIRDARERTLDTASDT